MKSSAAIFVIVLLLASSLSPTTAGPIASAICYTGCNSLAVACYAAAGFTFGTGKCSIWLLLNTILINIFPTVTAGAGIPAVIIACNAGLGMKFIRSNLHGMPNPKIVIFTF